MKGINYVTNDKGKKMAILINLVDHDKVLNEYLEDLQDLIEIEARKNEEKIPWNKAKEDLLKNRISE